MSDSVFIPADAKTPEPKDPVSDTWGRLIDAARNGCDDALAEIVDRLKSYLLLVADQRLGRDVQAKFGASDIVQISLLEATKSIDSFNGTSEAEVRSWLKRIVLNNLADESIRYTKTKARGVERESPLRDEGCTLPDQLSETPSVMLRRDEEDQQLRALVDRLPDAQRRVVEAKYRFSYSNDQIANLFSICEATVRKHLSRANKQLREWLGEDE